MRGFLFYPISKKRALEKFKHSNGVMSFCDLHYHSLVVFQNGFKGNRSRNRKDSPNALLLVPVRDNSVTYTGDLDSNC